MFLFWCDSGSFLRRKQGLWLLLTITGRSFTKHWRGTPTPLVLLGVLGPMVKKKYLPMVTCNLSGKTYYNWMKKENCAHELKTQTKECPFLCNTIWLTIEEQTTSYMDICASTTKINLTLNFKKHLTIVICTKFAPQNSFQSYEFVHSNSTTFLTNSSYPIPMLKVRSF